MACWTLATLYISCQRTHTCCTNLSVTCLLFPAERRFFIFFLRDGKFCRLRNTDPPTSNRSKPKRSITTSHPATHPNFKPTYIHTQEFWDHHMLLIFSVRRGCESLSQWELALSVITDPQAMGSVHMWALPVWLLSFYLKLTVQQTALIPAKGTHNTQERERVGNTFSSVSCLQMCLGMNGSNFRMLLTYPRGAQKHPSRLCVQYMH